MLSNEKSPKKPLSSVLLLLVIQNILSKSDEKFYELFFLRLKIYKLVKYITEQ